MALVALLGSALAAAVALATGPGQAWLAARVEERVNAELAGTVRIGRVAVRPGSVELADVEVLEPGGARVLDAERIFVAASLSLDQIRAGTYALGSVELAGVRVLVETPSGGGAPGIARAFQPRTPPAKEGPPPSPFEVTIGRLHVERGAVVVRTEGQPPAVALRELSLDLAGRVDSLGVEAKGGAAAQLHAPVRGAARLELDATLAGGFRALTLRSLTAGVGGSTASFAGEADLASLESEVRDLKARVLPEDARAFVPAWRPTRPLVAVGTASYRAGKVSARFDVDVDADEGGGARVDGELDLAVTPPVFRVAVETAELDPDAFDERAPRGSITAKGSARGRGLSDAMNVTAELAIAPTTLDDVPVGPASVRGAYDAGRIRIDELEATLPGGHVSLAGWVGNGSARLDWGVQAPALDRLLASVADVAVALGAERPDVPPLGGDVHARGQVDGELAHPHVSGQVRSASFRVGDARLEKLSAEIDVAGLPDRPRGRIAGRASRLVAGGDPALEHLALDLALAGRRAEGTVSAHSRLGPVSAKLGADLGPGYAWFRFDALQLSWPGARWTLAKPARLELGPPVQVDSLQLTSDGGSLEAKGRWSPNGTFEATVRARDVDLSRLPPGAIPKELGLAGKADLEAQLAGTPARPKGTAKFMVYGGKARGLSGVGVRGEVELAQARAKGAFTTVRDETQADVRFDVPFPFDERGALDLRFELVALDLAEVSRVAKLEAPLAGVIRASGELSGSARAPRGRVEVVGAKLSGHGVAGLEVDAVLELGERTAHLAGKASLEGATVTADVTAPVDAAALAREPRKEAARLDATPLAGRVQVAGLDLARHRVRLQLPEGVRGLVTLDATLEGTAKAPRGKAAVHLTGATDGRFEPVDLDVELAAAGASTSAQLVARMRGKPLFSGSVELGAAPEGLAGDGWEKAPLSARLATEAVELGPLLATVQEEGPKLAGQVQATLELAGTALSPTAELRAQTGDLRVGRSKLGRGTVEGRYSEGELSVQAAVSAAGGGEAKLVARWKADLSSAGIAAGAAAKLAGEPLDVELKARALDLGFLEALSGDIRQLEGRLDAELAVRGELPAPDLAGTVSLSKGRLSYTNYGDVRDIALDLSFGPDRAELKQFTAVATGALTARGSATRRRPGGPFELDVDLATSNFAIVASDLTRAYLDSKAKLTGELTGAKADTTLTILQGRITLPNTPPKSVQRLVDHADFVVVRKGETLEKVRAREDARTAKKVRAPSALDDAELRLAVVSKNDLQLQGIDIDMDTKVDLRLRAGRGEFNMSGSVEGVDGHVVVMNRRFEIERARVLFAGADPPDNPRLDVEATHASSYAEVTVNVSGSAQKPVTALRSNPTMTEAQIATLLATGRPELKRGGGGVSEASGAATALGAIATTQLRKGIAAKLPVDVISFQGGEEGFEGSSLEAGTYVTDRIYVGYSRNFGLAEEDRRNTNEVQVEYQLAPQWTVESTYGDNQAGGVDVYFTRDF